MSELERRRAAIASGLGRMEFVRAAAIPTGALSLDWALGTGGFPRGRIAEIFGPESCGKTTVALHAIAEAQRAGGAAAYIDADHALDPAYARSLRVDLGALLLSSPECGEEALQIAGKLAASRAVDLLVVDSVAALVPRLELEGGPHEDYGPLQHRLMEQALRGLAFTTARTGCCLLFVNQVRGRPGVEVGSPETTAGGYALRIHAAVRVELRPAGRIGEAGRAAGMRVRARVVKNKLAAPYREAAFAIRYGAGIDREDDLLACAALCGIAPPRGSGADDGSAAGGLELAVRRALGLQVPD